MLILNTPNAEEKEIEKTLGLVQGSTVRARNVGRDLFAGLKNIVGGEIGAYTKLLSDSRDQALERMIDEARNSVQMRS